MFDKRLKKGFLPFLSKCFNNPLTLPQSFAQGPLLPECLIKRNVRRRDVLNQLPSEQRVYCCNDLNELSVNREMFSCTFKSKNVNRNMQKEKNCSEQSGFEQKTSCSLLFGVIFLYLFTFTHIFIMEKMTDIKEKLDPPHCSTFYDS